MNFSPLSQHGPQSLLSKLQEQVKRLGRRLENKEDDLEKLKQENKTLKEILEEKERRIRELEEALQCKEAQRKALATKIWKAKTSTQSTAKMGKKPGSRGFFRPDPLPSVLTAFHTYSLEHCPDCGSQVGPANHMAVAYHEDIVLTPPSVEKYVVTRHWCGNCHKQVRNLEAPDLTRIRRIGLSTLGYILYARYRMDTPIPKICQSLRDLYGLKLSEGEIVNQLKEARALFGEDYQVICELLTQASVVHADETGFRVLGENWWLWVRVTPEGITQFQVHHSRGKGAAKNLLGTNLTQVRVTDFLGSYQDLPGPRQVCWVHLLRDARETHGQLHADLLDLYKELKEELKKPVNTRDPGRFVTWIERIATGFYGEEKPTLTLQKRLKTFQTELLTCLYHEGVSPENNLAERTIRPQVIKRKIFGSIRSLEGAITHETNSSVLTTYLNQTKSPFFEVILPILHSRTKSANAA